MGTFEQKLAEKVLLFDGAMGTELYRKNFFLNASYENLNLANPQVVKSIHTAYAEAGAEAILTNTFGANANKLGKFGLAGKVAEINAAGVRIARESAGPDILVGGSIGPAGNIPEGSGMDAGAVVAEHAKALAAAGPDFLMFETIASTVQLRNVLEAVKGISADLPYVVSFSVDRNGLTAHGEPVQNVFALLKEQKHQPAAFGLNCGVGPGDMLHALELVKDSCPFPIIVRPNSGALQAVDDRMINMCSPEYFTTYAMRFLTLGVRGIGGCCGTTPAHIEDMVRALRPILKLSSPSHIEVKEPETELKPAVPSVEKSELARKLLSGTFVHTVEIVPPQGYLLAQTIEKSKVCAAAGFDAVNIPDGPRASSRVSTLVTAYKIQQEAGIEAVLHCCCRDKNLIGMQAELLGCAAMNVNNILFITGDPPKLGNYPFASAVFDTDSIGIVKVQSRLNHGVDIGGKPIDAPTKAFIEVGADPNAIDFEREVRRLHEKIDAGAEAVVTQPVFDVNALRKLINAIPELKDKRVPLIAGIWPLASYRNAEFMRNEVPGVVVPDSVMERMAVPKEKEEQRQAGIAIAREAIAEIRDIVAGVQISAPFGNVQTAIAVMKPSA